MTSLARQIELHVILYTARNVPFVVPPLGGSSPRFRLKPVLRTSATSFRVQYSPMHECEIRSFEHPPEGKRMASGLTRNQVPGNRLRVRIPCPPLAKPCVANSYASLFVPCLYEESGASCRCYAGATGERKWETAAELTTFNGKL